MSEALSLWEFSYSTLPCVIPASATPLPSPGEDEHLFMAHAPGTLCAWYEVSVYLGVWRLFPEEGQPPWAKAHAAMVAVAPGPGPESERMHMAENQRFNLKDHKVAREVAG